MYRNFAYFIIAIVIAAALSACISDKDRADIQKMLDESNSKASSVAEPKQESKKETNTSEAESKAESISEKSESEKSGSTQIDNKQEPEQGQKDGITIHIPQSDIDKFNSELEEIREEFNEYSIIEYSTQYDPKDFEYSTSDDWKKPYDGGSNEELYPWK